MADVPSQVTYGEVVGHFVQFIADTSDPQNIPDELPLTGTVTLTPLTNILRYPSTTPPRLVIASPVVCRVLDGDLCPPGDETTPGVWVIATDQPAASPSKVQWQATFNLTGVRVQPSPIIFDVPAGGVIDLAVLTPVPPEPPAVLVVSNQDAVAAQQAADRAEAAADRAEAAAGGGVAASNIMTAYRIDADTWSTRPSTIPPPDVVVIWIGMFPEPDIATGAAFVGDIFVATDF